MNAKQKYIEDHFSEKVLEVASEELTVAMILDLPGVYEAVAEFLNNEVIDLLTEEFEEKQTDTE